MIYLDNAATSFPKPANVAAGIVRFLNEIGANPGRSGHRLSAESARIVFEAREKLAELLHAPDCGRIIFTPNATTALNTAILSLATEDAHIITSSMEHNSVMRPLRFLESSGRISLSLLHCSPEGEIDPGDIRKKIRGNTKLIVVQHASNVTGTLQPLREIVRAAREIPVLVDAAQTAGSFPIDVRKENFAMLAFTGHKALLGPTGTGGLFIRNDIEVTPLTRGGTGSRSESDEQPDFLPDALESGTLNVAGIAGLLEAVAFVLKTGVETIRKHELDLTMHFLKKIEKIDRVETYGPDRRDRRLPTVSLNIRGIPPSELSYALDREYGILTRPGLHCAPHAHKIIGTFPTGTVRFSFGFFNTAADVDAAVNALKALAWPPDAA
jgi:cysteine desulfurase/selenocysteine lyase